MPIENHPSFKRPFATTRLWRYIDIPKFLDLLVNRRLWLTNAEILAADDPFEGAPGPIQFPHRVWKCIDDVPEIFRNQIIDIYGSRSDPNPEAAFKKWFMQEEQACIFRKFGRRNFYINCWHAADYESVAMWKIYGSPGAGIAVLTSSSRMEQALASCSKRLHLGAIRYVDPLIFEIGTQNAFDPLMIKRLSYAYEREIRLVYWDTEDMHDPLEKFLWNDATMRFDEIVENPHPIVGGVSISCDVDAMIENLVISPFAPAWYLPMIERLKEQLSFNFPVSLSKLLEPPSVVP